MTLSDTEIQILPDFIANQIAAGEVVQRPESIVKELVENAFDAGADTIAVIVRGAGKQLIHVIDNGKGMSKEDVLLAPKRHATSKIKTAQDLEHILTLGFRGEALASISSVASLEIRTKRAQDELGWKLLAEPLQEPLLEPCAMDTGTQVFVRNLFYNVPARRKFLRSDLTEFRHIADTMMKFALSRPEVRIAFYDDDALIYDLHAAELHKRIADALGSRFAETLMPVDFTDMASGVPVRVHGFCGQPAFARKTKSEQFLYLNGRSISSRQLHHAVMSAYEHLIDQSGYPPYILFLELDPTKVDVNIHPQKHEVKFDDDRSMYSAVRRAIGQVLERSNLAPQAIFREQTAQHDSQRPFERMTLQQHNFGNEFSSEQSSADPYMQTVLVNRLSGEIIKPKPVASRPSQSTADERFPPPPRERRMSEQEFSAYHALFGKDTPSAESRTIESRTIESRSKLSANTQHDIPPEGAQQQVLTAEQFQSQNRNTGFYWQVHKKYIMQQTARGLNMIDQHAAHERILYERALKAMNEGFKYGQELLFPVQVELTVSDTALIQELHEELEHLGFHITLADARRGEIRSVPADVRTGHEEDALRELLEQYREYQELRHTSTRDNLAASFGCRSAIKAGDTLSIQEMRQLVEDLYATSMPYACPHGRPIIIEFSLDEIDRRFGRTS